MLYCEVKSPFYDIGLEFLFPICKMNRKVFIIVQLQMLLSASIPTLSLHDICPILASRTHKLSKHPQACIGINGIETDKDQQHQINKSQEEDNKQNDTITRIILYF